MLRWFCLFWVLLLFPCSLLNKQVTQASQYLGVQEKNNRNFNNIEFANKLRSVGWKPGNNWCAFFVSLILVETGATYPKITSGLARKFITSKSIPARRVLTGYPLKRNMLVIWQRSNTIFGHIGFVVRQVDKKTIYTIEGNVDDAVKFKTRKIELLNSFRITHFTEVQ